MPAELHSMPQIRRIAPQSAAPMAIKRPHPAAECWFWAGWEPKRHYQRKGGSRGTFYFGNGAWIDAWEQRLFSDEAISMAADMGATILITQFYKGLGRQIESPLWEKLQDYVGRCRQSGIKVWGYVQGSSIYPEFLRSEQPDLDDWIAVSHDGTPQRWGGAYYRLAPCLSSDAYRDYMTSIAIDGASFVGLDGLHVDNSYYRHCWCQRCQSRFREYLAARGDLEERTSIVDVQNVTPPPLPGNASYINDPLQILWMEFGIQTRREFYSHIRRSLETKNLSAALSGNSAFPRTDLACELRHALNPEHEGGLFDYCCAESGNQTRVENDVFVGQAESFLFAEAGGYRVWSTAWREAEFGNSPPPDRSSVWAVMAEEFSYGSAIPGNNWAFRPAGENSDFLSERIADRRDAFSEALRYFRALSELAPHSARRSWTDVGILIDAHSLSISGPSDTPAFRELQQYFLATKIPFQFVFPSSEIPDSVTTLVAWTVSCLSQETLEKLKQFARKPGRRVVVSESSGIFDEWHVPHDLALIKDWGRQQGVHVIKSRAGLPANGNSTEKSDYLKDSSVGLGGTAKRLLDEYFHSNHFHCRMRFVVPDSIVVHTERTIDGSMLVHLRDQAGSGNPVEGGKIWISDELQRSGKATFHTPGQPAKEIPFLSASEGGRCLSLPEFSIYGLLVVSADAEN